MENLELNKSYNGFKLTRVEHIDEINSDVLLFEHEKTGARLINIQNDDTEKVFSIGFRTPPQDNTGTPHILEHSVLNGSQNFPLSDPFAELARSTINSFINAFTYPDKTVYPFASTNESEFRKIMNVYLDAVFYPLIYKYPEILKQEGWRYVLENPEDELTYNGVVYGEIKGAYSSPQRLIENFDLKLLFPNNCYVNDSGGNPEYITDLDYQTFINFHKTYYHPSNSYIYIYGKTDILEHLKFLDENYLSKFEKTEINSAIAYQSQIDTQEVIREYPIGKDENGKNRTFLHLAYLICKNKEHELVLAFKILNRLLFLMPASPLRNALMKAKIGEDVIGIFDDNELLQSFFYITIQNSNPEQKEQFMEIVEKTLKNLVENGIDKNLIKAAINKTEFILKEDMEKIYKFTRGVNYYTKMMNTWLYDEDPLIKLKYNDELLKIKKESENGYFENLINEYFLNNKHKLILILKPNPDLNLDKKVKYKLAKYKSSLTKEQIEELVEQTHKFNQWQENGYEDQMESIPPIPISEIERKPQEIKIEKKTILNDVTLLKYKDFTKEITYLNMFFDVKTISKEKIQYLSLLEAVLTEAKTKTYSFDELSNLINTYTGGISYNLKPCSNEKNLDFTPKFLINAKVLDSNLPKLIEIINEITSNLELDYNKTLEILKQIKSRIETHILESGHFYTYLNNQSNVTDEGTYTELISGISYYQFLKDLIENYDIKKEEIKQNLMEVYEIIFNKNNLIIGLTSNTDNENKLEALKLKNTKYPIADLTFEKSVKSTAITTPADILYVGKGFNYKTLGYKSSGIFLVFTNYLRMKYLWEKLRVKGGAYTGISIIHRDGAFSLISYRDPRLKETLKDYDELSDYLRNSNISQEELNSYIIGAIAQLDTPLYPQEKGFKAAIDHIEGVTYEDSCREREEVLNTTSEAFKKLAGMVDEIMKKQNISVVGNERKIDENKDLFNQIISPFK